MGCHMANIEDEIDPTRVRSGLFALITARLEDANVVAVNGQATHLSTDLANTHINDIRSILSEIEIQLDAAELI